MFDIGFWELVLFLGVALIVVGPERLPRLARTAGLWLGRARRIVSEVKGEVERELRMEEIKQSISKQDAFEEMKQLANRVKSINSEIHEEVDKVGHQDVDASSKTTSVSRDLSNNASSESPDSSVKK